MRRDEKGGEVSWKDVKGGRGGGGWQDGKRRKGCAIRF